MKTLTIYMAVWVTAVLLVGCSSLVPREAPPEQGNLVSTFAPAQLDAAIEADIVTQLATLYPPANTSFYFMQPTHDVFGRSLTLALRDKGYFVTEYQPGAETGTEVGLRLGYLVDTPPDTNVYRVLLTVGPQSLSRAYVVFQSGGVAPGGPWTREE